MRSTRWSAAVALTALAACGGGDAPPLTTLADSASYAIGMNMGASIREVRDEVRLEQLMQGLRDLADGRATRLSEQEAGRVLQAFATEVRQRQEAGRTAMADSNQQGGDAYRESNGQRTGVTTTASGLQYEVLTAGTGPRPTASDRARVHYKGTLIDGTAFDSSYGGDPVTFEVSQLIGGWTEALQLMPVGSKYRIVVPPNLGYGPGGSPPDIPPNATLVFELELLGIER
jgi:FKBP-type peptidyl-prolyl cis-trans isomerase FkpA/FKBP-type peptidyl-prolyl cis-trans isomerase FklB